MLCYFDKSIVCTVVQKRLRQIKPQVKQILLGVFFATQQVGGFSQRAIFARLDRAHGSSSPMSLRHRNLEPLGRWHATVLMTTAFMDFYHDTTHFQAHFHYFYT